MTKPAGGTLALAAALALLAGCSDTTAPGTLPSVHLPQSKPAVTGTGNPVVRPVASQAKTPASTSTVETKVETPAAVETPGAVEKPAAETPTATAQAKPAASSPLSTQQERSFKIDPASGALRIGYDDLDLLKVLSMDPVTKDAVEKMPQWLRDLSGKRIIIRGFMRQAFSETGLTDFVMVRDMGLCCFGPMPKIYDMIQVKMKDGTTTDYIELKPFDVVGTFRIEMQADDELKPPVYGLYFIDDAQVIRRR